MTDETRISEAAVKKATGKGWAHWLRALDRFGEDRGHAAAARHLAKEHGLDGWWSQAVTVRWEKERGLRQKYQKPGGFEISVSRSIACAPERAWEAFTRARELNRWFGERARVNLREGGRYNLGGGDVGEYRRIDPPRLLRFTWDNAKHCPGTTVEVRFTEKKLKSGLKTGVVLRHLRLPDRQGAEDLREGWSWALDSLRSYLETGKRITWEDWQAAR